MQVPRKFSITPRKLAGAHYTPEELADFVAVQVASECKVDSPRVVDPAVGDGQLLLAVLRQFDGNAQVFGYDTNPEALDVARSRLTESFPSVGFQIETKDFLSVALDSRANELFSSQPNFDAAIANPPYVRTQVMGAIKAQWLAKHFNLAGRVDLYFAFIEGIAEVLKPGGIAGVIVSNRFMTTRSGEPVRSRILDRFDVLHVWDLGDTRLFEAAVLPCVLLLRKKNGLQRRETKFSSIYTTDQPAKEKADNPIEALKLHGVIDTPAGTFLVRHGLLDHDKKPEGVWKIATAESDEWLETVRAHTFCTFGDIGKIRVGVKTTADKVFVRKDWGTDSERPELLRPLVTHHVARRFKASAPDREILYPHTVRDGRKVPVDIDGFPTAKAYLENHRAILESRTYVIEAGRKWFEIWVPQHPAQWSMPKLVFLDISKEPTFWMSLGNEIIHGDCYWLPAPTDEAADLLWLALAIGNSTFIEEFYDHEFHNKLYAGRRRFMTQYVEKFPLPDPKTKLARNIVATVKRVYDLTPSEKAERLAAGLEKDIRAAFGLSVEEIAR